MSADWPPDIAEKISRMDPDDPWTPVRLRALASIDRGRSRAVERYCNSRDPDVQRLSREFRDALDRALDAARAVVNVMWMPERPGRRMASVPVIARYWAEQHEVFDVDLADPRCFACGRSAPAWAGAYFDRAHLVDRWAGGLDHEGNLVLLCTDCHRVMPTFKADEGPEAIAWVLSGGVSALVAAIMAET